MDTDTEILEELEIGKAKARAACRKPPYHYNGNGKIEEQRIVPTIVPAIRALPDNMVAEQFVETLTEALSSFDLTDSARELLEKGLYGQIEVNVGQVVSDLQGLVDSPLQGIMEANRLGTMGKLYQSIDIVLASIMGDLDEMEVPKKLRFLDLLLLRLKSLNEVGLPTGGSGGGKGSPKGMVPAGSMELSQTKTVRVSLIDKKDRRRTDAMLGYEERPGADYLEQ
jgi:hypothetical protein